jgi:UDP-2,3-diacylglucosamine hydrolase
VKSEELVSIKENALFVADAHYPHHGKEFLLLLEKLESGKIATPQLFLMGDIFDLLFGYNDYIRTFLEDEIALLDRLSRSIEIHYFEGNHDFLLKDIFPNIKMYPRESQPVVFHLGEKRVGISHGDRYAQGFDYDLYCKIIRSKYLITLLRPMGKWLIDDRLGKLAKKKICRPMKQFEERVSEIAALYGDIDLIIEGHYHQGRKIGKYVSLPSLACQKQVAVVRGGEICFMDFTAL